VSLVMIDVEHFKAYNDFYSYRAGDEVIKFMARVLSESIEQKGNPRDFVGHIGGDDFVVITTPDRADEVAATIIELFDGQVQEYYRPAERAQGYVEIANRQNKMEQFPLVSVTIALVESDRYQIEHVAMLNDVVAELKHVGKQRPGSVVVRERRQSSTQMFRTGSDG
jgi:diguanylate cyclase (GGDEF)-like protein